MYELFVYFRPPPQLNTAWVQRIVCVLLIFLVGGSSSLEAASYASVSTGNWNATTTWDSVGIPQNTGGTTLINHNVTLNTSGATSYNIQLNPQATLEIQTGGELTCRFLNLADNSQTSERSFILTGGTATMQFLHVSWNTSSETGIPLVDIRDGEMVVQNDTRNDGLVIGYGTGTGLPSKGQMKMSGGTVNVTGVANFLIGLNNTGNGIVEMTGGTVSVTKDLRVGNNGTGTLEVTGGEITANNLIFGQAAGGLGTGIVGGGKITVKNELIVGNSSPLENTFEMTDGEIQAARVFLGNNGGNGTWKLSGGMVDVTQSGYKDIYVGNWGLGTLILDGDATLKANTLTLGHHITATSRWDIIGGGSTIDLGILKTGGSTTGAKVNFTVDASGISTIQADTLTLKVGTELNVGTDIAGFGLEKETLTLIQTTNGQGGNLATITVSSPLLAEAVKGENDLTIAWNPDAEQNFGERFGWFSLNPWKEEGIHDFRLETNLSGEELEDLALWLAEKTGYTTEVAMGGIYVLGDFPAADVFAWDFATFEDANAVLTGLGVNRAQSDLPEPGTFSLILLGMTGWYFLRGWGRKKPCR